VLAFYLTFGEIEARSVGFLSCLLSLASSPSVVTEGEEATPSVVTEGEEATSSVVTEGWLRTRSKTSISKHLWCLKKQQ
jgi:hypothetical protein